MHNYPDVRSACENEKHLDSQYFFLGVNTVKDGRGVEEGYGR